MPDRRVWAAEIALVVADLERSQAAVLRCRYFDGLSEADTVITTGLSIGQVRRAAARGLGELARRILINQHDEATNAAQSITASQGVASCPRPRHDVLRPHRRD